MINLACKKVASAAFFASALLMGATEAIYQTDRGKNEWHVETLGEISDLILFADSQAYTLSTDGLLTLFNTSE